MALPHHVRYRLVVSKREVACEVPASRPDRRAWLSVVPIGEDDFSIVYIEVMASDYSAAYDSMDYDKYFVNRSVEFITGEESLESALRSHLSNIESLVDPYIAKRPY